MGPMEPLSGVKDVKGFHDLGVLGFSMLKRITAMVFHFFMPLVFLKLRCSCHHWYELASRDGLSLPKNKNEKISRACHSKRLEAPAPWGTTRLRVTQASGRGSRGQGGAGAAQSRAPGKGPGRPRAGDAGSRSRVPR